MFYFLLVDVDGYVEDGREIFDDDLDEATIVKEEKKGRGKKRNRTDKSFDEDTPSTNRDIQKMFASMPVKKKKEVSSFYLFNFVYKVYYYYVVLNKLQSSALNLNKCHSILGNLK